MGWIKWYLVIISVLELKFIKQKEPICNLVPKAWFFLQNSSVPFHQVTFGHSISCVLLINKPNESCKNSKTFEWNALFTKKVFKKKREYLTSKGKRLNFTNFFRTPKINDWNLSNEKQENLKWSLDNFERKYQKHFCQLFLISVMTLNQLFLKPTREKFHPLWGYFRRRSKNIYNFSKIMLHITPWTLTLMLYIRQAIYLVLISLLSSSFLMFCITIDEISSTLSIQFW